MVSSPLGRNLSLWTEIRKERVKKMKWKNEAMDKLRRYDVMRQALRNIPAEIEDRTIRLVGKRVEEQYRD